MEESYFNQLKAHLYKFEVIHEQAVLRLYINGEKKNVHILIEAEKGLEAYLEYNLKLEDQFSLKHWFSKLEKQAI